MNPAPPVISTCMRVLGWKGRTSVRSLNGQRSLDRAEPYPTVIGSLAGLTAVEFAIVALAETVGAMSHGALGIGFAFVVTPVLAIAEPRALPATVLLLGLLRLSTAIATIDRRHIDTRGVPVLFIGRLVGTGAAVALLTNRSERDLSVIFGTALALSALASLAAPHGGAGRGMRLAAGVASGLLGTTVGAGAAPLALAYSERDVRDVPVVRSTLSVIIITGILISVAALAAAGGGAEQHVLLAGSLVPAIILGTMLSRLVTRRIPDRPVRWLITAFALASGAALIVQGIRR